MRSCKPFHVFLLTAVGSALVIVCALCFIEFTSQGLAQQLAQQRQSAPLPESVQRANPPDSSQNAPPAENLTLHARWHELIPEERVNIMVYDKCNRSVANINTKITTNLLFGEIDTPGGGSGIVIDKAGHILTNFHVVEDATKVEVTLFNGKSYEAKKIGVDPITDIAVLKVDATPEELYPISFGDSTQLLVGQKIYAIGNPFGLESTLTGGLISSLNRTIGGRSTSLPIRGVIQIDAAINPGNSGGPLLDTQGRMIGMNTAIASRVEQSSGVGFAIPSNTVQRIVPQILQNGKVVRADIGIERAFETEEGLVVLRLTPGGAAEKAGIQVPKVVKVRERRGPITYEKTGLDRSTADVIVAVNGKPAKKAEDFIALVEENTPGDRLVLTLLRGGKQIDVPVVLN